MPDASQARLCTRQFNRLFKQVMSSPTEADDADFVDLLHFHATNKSSIHPRLARKIVFQHVPELIFSQHVDNSTLLAALMSSIHRLMDTVSSPLVMFLALNAAGGNRTLPLETLLDRQFGEEVARPSYSFVAYFLHHCSRGRLLFDGKRVTELIEGENPLLYGRILLLSDPKCVLTMLQYGLRFDSTHKSELHPIFHYILDLLSKLETSSENLITLLQNFKMILLSSYNPYWILREMMLVAAQAQKEKTHNILDKFLKFNFGCDASEAGIPSLKHFCRCAIREQMHQNWRLPYGIYQSPLKLELANYVNLREK